MRRKAPTQRTSSEKLQAHSLLFLQVAEKLMLAHCEQELAQRARLVSETRATIQLPPFAQVCC